MSTPPRWTKEELKPELQPREVWTREDNGHRLVILRESDPRMFWWWIDGDGDDLRDKPTLHAAKCAATMALKRITKRSE